MPSKDGDCDDEDNRGNTAAADEYGDAAHDDSGGYAGIDAGGTTYGCGAARASAMSSCPTTGRILQIVRVIMLTILTMRNNGDVSSGRAASGCSATSTELLQEIMRYGVRDRRRNYRNSYFDTSDEHGARD